MPEHKTVMISSTARDLPEHRREAMDACLRQGMFPVMMEHLPASDDEAIAGILPDDETVEDKARTIEAAEDDWLADRDRKAAIYDLVVAASRQLVRVRAALTEFGHLLRLGDFVRRSS